MNRAAPPGNGASRPSASLDRPEYLTLPDGSLPHTASDVIQVPLSVEQARQLAPPLAHRAAEQCKNVIFFAVAIPFWSLQEQSVVWELQATIIPGRLGEKIKKLVLNGSKPE
jgi:hypothetical protein